MTAFAGFDLEAAIRVAAEGVGEGLGERQVAALAGHARAVAASNERLHLTAIREPGAFVERHVAESLAGAALLERDVRGVLVDLGSGNGYPGIPLAVVRPGLRAVLVESAPRKAAFLSSALQAAGLTGAGVLEANVQNAADLAPLGLIRVLATRAMGGWERLLPKLAPTLEPRGEVLLWAGDRLDEVCRRVAWRRFRRVEERRLPSLDRGVVARLTLAGEFD